MIYDYEMDMSKSLTKGISSTVIIAIKQSKFPIKLPTRIRSQTRVRSPLIQKGGVLQTSNDMWQKCHTGWWYTYPSEKYECQLG